MNWGEQFIGRWSLLLSICTKNVENFIQKYEYNSEIHDGIQISQNVLSGTGSFSDPYKIQVDIENRNHLETWKGLVELNYDFKANSAEYCMPAFMYGTNRGDTPTDVINKYPRVQKPLDEYPTSQWWMTRSDRLSHPVVIVTTKEKKIMAICASPYLITNNGQKQQWIPETVNGKFDQYCGFMLNDTPGYQSIGYTIGYQNAPYFFERADIVKKQTKLKKEGCLNLDPNEKISVFLNVYDTDFDNKLDVHEIIKQSYYEFHETSRDISSIKECVTDISKAIEHSAYMPNDHQYSGMVHADGSFNSLPSYSWTNGLSVAVPLLISAIRNHDDALSGQSKTVINKIIKIDVNSHNGLPFDSYDKYGNGVNHGWWFNQLTNKGHSGYIIGQGIYYLLKAYDYEKSIKHIVNEQWLNYAENVCKHLAKGVNSDFEFPYLYSEFSEAGVEYDSLGSAWCATAIAYIELLTEDSKYLNLLKKSEEHYFEKYVKQLDCYGGPLDTSKSPDNEGILAFIRLAHIMHEITSEEKYLSHIKYGLYQEFSYKFSYNSPIKVNPLMRIGWSSCGGDVTSVCNPHIHPMSSSIIDDTLYYYEITGDNYVFDRLKDTINWGKQSYNRYDNEYDFGRKGWMSERFCYSEGLLTQKYKDGSPSSTWFNLLPWAGASIVEGYVGKVWEMEAEWSGRTAKY